MSSPAYAHGAQAVKTTMSLCHEAHSHHQNRHQLPLLPSTDASLFPCVSYQQSSQMAVNLAVAKREIFRAFKLRGLNVKADAVDALISG